MITLGFLVFSITHLVASESAELQLQKITRAQFVAVILVDQNRQLRIHKIIKDNPIIAAETPKIFWKIGIDLPKNTRYLYMITEPKKVNGVNISIPRFIQIYFGDHIFIDNRPVYWPDLFKK